MPQTFARNGYLMVYVGGVGNVLAHRLAWFLFYGTWPDGVIDHINGCCTDNRICNLRDVDSYVNGHNRHRVRSDNISTGITGASLHRTGRYRSEITVRGARYYLGLFDTPKDAANAYIQAKQRLLMEAQQ